MGSHLPYDSLLYQKLLLPVHDVALDDVAVSPRGDYDSASLPSVPIDEAAASSTRTVRSVAAISKRQRDKKRKELEDLKVENSILKDERERFLAKIDDLTCRVQEMREKDGEVDLQVENELLKAQLEEHRSFVQGLMRMASGVPSTADEKRRLYSQGADFAAAQVQSLLTRSAKQASEWQRATISPQWAARFPRGITFDVCYQIITEPDGSRRLHVRTNQTMPGIKAKNLAEQYWGIWTSEETLHNLYKAGKFELRQEDHIEMTTVMVDEIPGGASEKLATLMQNNGEKQFIYVASQRLVEITRGVLMPVSLVTHGDGPDLQPWKRTSVVLLSRSSSTNQGSQQSPVFAEGSVSWDSEAGGTLATIVSVPEHFRCGMQYVFFIFVLLPRTFLARR